jgi:SAM-dependent methyltransferase
MSEHIAPNTPIVDKSTPLREKVKILLEKTARSIPKTSRVLDFGCGYGFYFKINPLALGVDGDPNCVDLINSKFQEPKVKLANFLEKLPYPEDQFSYVLAHDVFEHFHLDELKFIVQEIHRILETKGKLVVWVPNEKGFYFSMHAGHKLYVTEKEIFEIAEGFFNVQKSYPEPLPRFIGKYFAHNKEVFVLEKIN